MNGLLSGMRIVEGSAFVAAPLAGLTLGQLGAEVIRFEPIGGGIDRGRWPVTDAGESLYWTSLNRGKRAIAVDLRHPEGRDLVQALICAPGKDAGLFLTNFPAEGWLSYETLKAKRADLVMAVIRGQPDGGPAVDYTVNAASGFPMATGPEGHDGPVNHVLPAWDIATGLSAALGLIAAERHRLRTGEGQLVRLSLMDSALAMMGHLGLLAEAQVNGTDRPRGGNDLYGAFGRDFATADGERLMLVALTDRQWRAVVEATGLEAEIAKAERTLGLDFKQEGDRYLGREALNLLIGGWIAEKPYAEVATAFQAQGALFERYQTFAELAATDPRCSLDNPLFAMVDQPGIGPMMAPGALLDFSGHARLPPKPAPRVGQHTDEILAEVLGLPAAAIGGLHDRKIVA